MAISTSTNTEDRVQELNVRYQPLSPEARVVQLYKDFNADEVMLTSSFATNSAFLLHLFALHAPHQLIYFIDTGYHFPETLEYKKKLTKLYHLNVEDVHPDDQQHEFTLKEQLWKSDPDFCCSINKVLPLHDIKSQRSVWVSGLMRWQTPHRAKLNVFEAGADIIKFHPLIDVSKEQRDAYIREHQLPFHPLVAQGYSSLGCTHCTRPGDDRSGRWYEVEKTECGLHVDR